MTRCQWRAFFHVTIPALTHKKSNNYTRTSQQREGCGVNKKTKAWVTIEKGAAVLYNKHAGTREWSSSPSNFRLRHGTKQTNRFNTRQWTFHSDINVCGMCEQLLVRRPPAPHCVTVIVCSATLMQLNMHVIACMWASWESVSVCVCVSVVQMTEQLVLIPLDTILPTSWSNNPIYNCFVLFYLTEAVCELCKASRRGLLELFVLLRVIGPKFFFLKCR